VLPKGNANGNAATSMMPFGNSPSDIHSPMRSIRSTRTRVCLALIGLTAGVVSLGSDTPAAAGELMFRRSYYTHDIPPELEEVYPRPASRSAYRPALVGTTPGFAIRGAHRFNRIFLRSGNSTDLTIIREDWYELTPPFAE
jgi:hypothetical protein